jgi:hypothetical protein
MLPTSTPPLRSDGRDRRAGRSTRIRFVVALIVFVASIVPGIAPIVVASSTMSSADVTQEERCGVGDVAALFQAGPVAAAMRLRGQDHPGLLGALSRCQYRVFGGSFGVDTFCEDDFILGGIVYLYDYKAVGVSRADAITELDLATDRVWIDGVEQALERTTYKDITLSIFGRSVYQHRGVIIRLPPGDHVSVWHGTYPGYPDETVTVDLHILPRESCV